MFISLAFCIVICINMYKDSIIFCNICLVHHNMITTKDKLLQTFAWKLNLFRDIFLTPENFEKQRIINDIKMRNNGPGLAQGLA